MSKRLHTERGKKDRAEKAAINTVRQLDAIDWRGEVVGQQDIGIRFNIAVAAGMDEYTVDLVREVLKFVKFGDAKTYRSRQYQHRNAKVVRSSKEELLAEFYAKYSKYEVLFKQYDYDQLSDQAKSLLVIHDVSLFTKAITYKLPNKYWQFVHSVIYEDVHAVNGEEIALRKKCTAKAGCAPN